MATHTTILVVVLLLVVAPLISVQYLTYVDNIVVHTPCCNSPCYNFARNFLFNAATTNSPPTVPVALSNLTESTFTNKPERLKPFAKIPQNFTAHIPRTVTNSQFIFIFKEDTPFLFFTKDCSKDLGWIQFLCTRLGSFFICALFKYFKCRKARRGTSSPFCSKHSRFQTRKYHRLSWRKRQFHKLVNIAFILILLFLCGDVHPNPGPRPCLQRSRRHPEAHYIISASWNVRTLLDTKRAPARPTAIVSHYLKRYNIDIAALSETRVLGENIIQEPIGGYTFFLKGYPVGNTRQHGVGFAIRNELVPLLQGKDPVGINERLMTLSLPLKDCTLSIISCYAPTLPSSDGTKEAFYGALNDTINSVPSSHKLLVMGDFNARVGADHSSWEDVIGKHGVGNENSNGTLLLSLCSQQGLVITNTIFQQADRHKTTWMHPRTKKWHMIDYVITRQRDIKDIHHTRAMCAPCTWSDHRLVKAKLALKAKVPHRRSRVKPQRKPDVAKLKSAEVRETLATRLHAALESVDLTASTAEDSWSTFRDTTLKVSEEVLGFPERKHRDWFDENDPLIKPKLNQLHDLYQTHLDDASNIGNADAYRKCKQEVQKSLRSMQNSWWRDRASELQDAADKRDYKTFYQGLKAVYGPIHKASNAIKSKDGVVLTEQGPVLDRWAEHFQGVLNQNSEFDMSLLDEIPQWDINLDLDTPPTLEEVSESTKQLSSGKSPGDDCIPPEIYKHGGDTLVAKLLDIFIKIWQEGEVVQQFRNATIIHLYKNKGDRANCDNHRGISLLCTAGKVLARLLLNRLSKHAKNINIFPESQCGFRPGRGTDDMVFALRQLQEKCMLQGLDLYLLFIDLTKAFDTINRDGLWKLLEKVGCPAHFVGIIRSFHENMEATVRDGTAKSPPFNVTCGTKQGCVLAPTLFSIFFSLMLHTAFKDATDGVDIKTRFDKGLCGVKTTHFNAPTKVTVSTIRDLLFADDCALAATSIEALQRLCDLFARAARRFGLTISIKKTEALYQPARGNFYTPPVVSIEGKQLNAVESFKYLGGTVTNDASLDAEVTARIARATSSYGRLTKRLWANTGIRLGTKVAVYKAAVLTSLLYGCETWTLNTKQLKRLEVFHLATLRKIAKIKWIHKVPNYEVLSRCNINTLQSMIETAKLRWTGHVVRMSDSRIPKKLLYGRLVEGRSRRGNHNTYLNSVKSTLRACGIDGARLESLAAVRGNWRHTVKTGIGGAEADRINGLIRKREIRKAKADLALHPA